MDNVYYVYVYLDPRICGDFKYGGLIFDHLPFYVGKGKNKRAYEHIRLVDKEKCNLHKRNKIKSIIRETSSLPLVIKLYSDLTENDALQLESHIINLIGRKDLSAGPLLNLTDGGDGITNVSESTRKLISDRMKGENNPNWMGKCNYGNRNIYGEQNPFYGKRHSEKTKNAIRLARSQDTEETKKKRSESFKRTRQIKKENFCNKYEFISPTGTVYIISDGFDAFCKAHNLNQSTMSKKMRDPTYTPSRGNSLGWKVKRLN